MKLLSIVGLGLTVAGIASAESAHKVDPVALVKDRFKERVLKRKSLQTDPYKPNFKPRNSRSCPKPLGGRDEEDRYCEDSFQEVASCGCKQVCHVWGDPHVSPYFSSCSEVAMSGTGRYVLYALPDNGDTYRHPISIEAEVFNVKLKKSKTGSGNFVKELYIAYDSAVSGARTNGVHKFNGLDPVMEAKNCEKDPGIFFQNVFPLYNDTVDEKNTILLELRASCNLKHTPHLNITITYYDYLIGAESENVHSMLSLSRSKQQLDRTGGNVPDSTQSFTDDYGVCTNPRKYDVAVEKNRDVSDVDQFVEKEYPKNPFWTQTATCKRPSGLADGRDCACRSNCAAYGDPRIHAFNEVPERGNDFHMDISSPEFRVLYSLSPFYSAVVQVNECSYMVGFYAIYLKDTLEHPDDLSHEDNYHIAYYDAETLCANPEDVKSATRKTILAPSKAVLPSTGIAQIDYLVYDDLVGGFNTGSFLVDDAGKTTFVPKSVQDLSSFITAQNADPAKILVSGGVQAILKCHTTDRGRRNKEDPFLFFNICIQRSDINVDEPPRQDVRMLRRKIAKKEKKKSGVKINDPAVSGLIAIEAALESAGSCAVGRPLAYDRKTNKYTSFEHRPNALSSIKQFPINPEVSKFCERNPASCKNA